MEFDAKAYEDAVREKRAAVVAMFGPAADISVDISVDIRHKGAIARVWPAGIVNSDRRSIEGLGDTMLAALDDLEGRAADAIAEYETDTIRKLALAIISLTDRDGVVTETSLQRETKIEMQRVRQMSYAACEKATEMGHREFAVLQNTTAA